MTEGKFITFEGGEGSGKTTQINLLKEYFAKHFPEKEVIFTREPGGTPYAEEIRNVMLGDGAGKAHGLTILSLIMASRVDHIFNLVLPALERDAVVISDRYYGSSFAYNIVAQENREGEDIFWAYVKKLPQADMTLFFDVTSEVAMERVNARNEKKNHFDKRGIPFYEAVRNGYLEFMRHPVAGKSVTIDASQTPKEIHAEVVKLIESL